MDVGDGVTRVANVLRFARAVCGALPLEGPHEAHILTSVLGDLGFLARDHVGHFGVRGFFEATEQPLVSVGVENAHTSGGLANVAVVGQSRTA